MPHCLISSSSSFSFLMLDFLVDSYIVVWILVRLLLSEPRDTRCDVLAGFSITMTSHIGTTKLGGVIVIMISLKFLGHQKQPIFKSGFFSISEQQRVRNLSWFAGRSCTCSSMVHGMQGVIGDLVGVCILVKSHLVQLFSGFIKSVLHQDNLTIFSLSI